MLWGEISFLARPLQQCGSQNCCLSAKENFNKSTFTRWKGNGKNEIGVEKRKKDKERTR